MVDNASNDSSAKFIEEKLPEVKLVQNKKNIGFGPAVNNSMTIGKREYFLFLNNDLSLEPNCVSELIKSLEKLYIGGAVPKILFFNKRDAINSFGVDVNYARIVCPRFI